MRYAFITLRHYDSHMPLPLFRYGSADYIISPCRQILLPRLCRRFDAYLLADITLFAVYFMLSFATPVDAAGAIRWRHGH